MPLELCSWTPPVNPIQCAMEPSYVGNNLQLLAKQWLTYIIFPKFKNLTSQNFWITPYTLPGLSTGCFPRRWTLLSARKLVPKKLKNIFSKIRYSHAHAHYFIVFIYLATWRAAKLGIFTHFMFTNLLRCSQSINSLIYVYSIQIPSCFLWVLDHSRDHTSSYYRRPKLFCVLSPEIMKTMCPPGYHHNDLVQLMHLCTWCTVTHCWYQRALNKLLLSSTLSNFCTSLFLSFSFLSRCWFYRRSPLMINTNIYDINMSQN